MNFFSILIDVLIVLIFLAVALFFSRHGLDRAIHMIGKAWLSVACALFVGPKITALLENTAARADMQTEHGLSLYVETATKKILFDMGQSDLFAANADALSVDLASVDTAVLSHGHYDS